MTYRLELSNDDAIIFSDSSFKPYRKKPTMSIYMSDINCEQKVASFNSQESFEFFVKWLNDHAGKETK